MYYFVQRKKCSIGLLIKQYIWWYMTLCMCISIKCAYDIISDRSKEIISLVRRTSVKSKLLVRHSHHLSKKINNPHKYILASCRADQSTLITVLKRQGADGGVCLAGRPAVIDRLHRLAGRSTIK